MATHANLVHVDDVPASEHAFGELRARRTRLAAAAGATEIGVSRWELPPGARSTPPHVHSDEEEIFYVLRGSGLVWLDGTTYAIAAGDALLHRTGEEAHTLIAGDDGLDVLAFSEGSRTRITFLPRTGQFWLGARWVPADSPHPYKADAALGPLEVPAPSPERPPTILHVDAVERESLVREGYDLDEANLGIALGRRTTGLRHDRLRPRTKSCPHHWHQIEEECFYVLEGSGEAVLGEARFALRPGSFLLRPPGSRVAHHLLAGDDGMTYLAYGTHRPNEICFYPDSSKLLVGDVLLRVDPVDDYWAGE